MASLPVLGFFMCEQMLAHVVAQRVCTHTVGESVQKADSGSKSLAVPGAEPVSAACWASAELHPHLRGKKLLTLTAVQAT